MPISWKTRSGTISGDKNVQWRWLAGDDPILDQGENLLIDPSSQATFLIAKINHEWVGQFQSGHYDLHAEEVLLETLRQNWHALLTEKVVWRPTKAQPRNVLSIKLTRSPCDESGHTCGRKIVAFLKAMNVSASADEADILKYNPMRVNWNLHIRTKIRTIYKGKPASTENLQKSKEALKHLIDNGVLVRPWEMEETAKTKEVRTGSSLPKTESHVHEMAYIRPSFFAQKVSDKGYKSQSRSKKLEADIKELNTFLNEAYSDLYKGLLYTKPSDRSSWSSFLRSARLHDQPIAHLRAFVLVTLKAMLEEKMLAVLQQMLKEAEPSLLKLDELLGTPVVKKPEEYEEYLAKMEVDFTEQCQKKFAEQLHKALNS